MWPPLLTSYGGALITPQGDTHPGRWPTLKPTRVVRALVYWGIGTVTVVGILPKGAGGGFISGFVPYPHTLIPN